MKWGVFARRCVCVCVCACLWGGEGGGVYGDAYRIARAVYCLGSS